jgi:hypothetical protein
MPTLSKVFGFPFFAFFLVEQYSLLRACTNALMYYRQVGLVLTHLVVLSAGLPPATFWAWALVRETILSVDKVIFASLFFIGFIN